MRETKRNIWKEIYDIHKDLMYFKNEFYENIIKYYNYENGDAKGRAKEIQLVDRKIEMVNKLELLSRVQRKLERYPNSTEYQRIYEVLHLTMYTWNLDESIKALDELIKYHEELVKEEENKLKDLNEFRKIKKHAIKEAREYEILWSALQYTLDKMSLVEAMAVCKIKDKRTLIKYADIIKKYNIQESRDLYPLLRQRTGDRVLQAKKVKRDFSKCRIKGKQPCDVPLVKLHHIVNAKHNHDNR